ncbi:hypothetical protein QAD02_008975 [Eretmocerus hayati]|uniref:Uncharacterized protein n=1 Tax=Eretmocerus hayati TaxID=131215 RepID=A0ACC2N886_9HYME|nr:hypothetical protein QAD02_008975 [Eretmocerus hayati]
MGLGTRLILFGISLAVAAVFLLPSTPPKPPKLTNKYWGPGQEPARTAGDDAVRPFKIKFDQQMVQDLRNRLRNIRTLQPPLENVNWTYGVSSTSMLPIVDYWMSKYDFDTREAHLNRYPQYITNIQGLDIHFYHIKPKLLKDRNVQVLPLLMLHGWPGSTVEFQKIIPLLTTVQSDMDFVFELIVPSLPGFGFSSAAAKPGFGPAEIAHVFKNLMLRLGFDKFYAQGGDWGGIIIASMATMYPQYVSGIHLNYCQVLRPWTYVQMALYDYIPWLLPAEERPFIFSPSKLISLTFEETGYLHEQATKPDTIGIGLSDSPVGLAAYILEKFSTVTNFDYRYEKDGNLLEKFTLDELIDNLMMYWVPNKITSSVRIYAEALSPRFIIFDMDNIPVTVPSACAQAPHEIIFHPESILRKRFLNLVRLKKVPRGGHLLAMEEPKLLADEVWLSVQKMRKLDTAE